MRLNSPFLMAMMENHWECDTKDTFSYMKRLYFWNLDLWTFRKELKADRPHPRDYSTHRQTP